MDSVDCLKPGAPSTPDANATPEAEWQSIQLEESSRSEMEYYFSLTEGKQMTEPSRKLDYSMCGLSKLISGDANDETDASKVDCKYISIKASEDFSGVKEVRVTIHGLEDPKKCSENVMYKTGNKLMNEGDSIVGHGDEGCLPLLQQVRAFIKGAKLSCAGLMSGDSKPFLYGWSSLLQRSFSFKSSEASSEGESLCKTTNGSRISRTTSAQTTTSKICSTGAAKAMKPSPLKARDPASRAEALPLAHYRPTDGIVWKEGDAKSGQSPACATSPVTVNCKKPPKPPRHPGRSVSLDSATIAAQRAAKKSRDRASAKRKSRGAANAAAGTGLSPLVAVVLTIGFGILMVFQGLFIQPNVSYGRNTDSDIVNAVANSRFSLPAQKADSFDSLHPIDPNLPASSNVDVGNAEAILSGALQKSMTDLPWSRSLLISQVKSTSG